MAALSQVLQSLEPVDPGPSAEKLDNALTQWTALVQAGRQCLSPLTALQQELDAQFVAKHAAALEPRLKELRRLSRREAAEWLVQAHAPQNAVVVHIQSPPEETDLYGAIDQILSDCQDETMVNLILLTDGGHNGPAASDAGRKLRKAGVAFTAIGVGTPSTGAGPAIVDWQAPRLLQSRSSFAIRAAIKAVRGQKVQFSLSLQAGPRRLAEKTYTTAGEETFWCQLVCEGLAVGRHVLSLRLDPTDAGIRSKEVRFIIDAVPRDPKALLLGDLPDWDTAYLDLAAQRAGLSCRQVYHGVRDQAPKRGISPGAIPKTVSQWASHRLVILRGAALPGLDDGDAEALFRYVTEQGGSLLIIVTGPDTYLRPLAGRFHWSAEALPLADCRLRVSASARGLPVLKVGVDNAESVRRIGSLGASGGLASGAAMRAADRKSRGRAVALAGFLRPRQGLSLRPPGDALAAGVRACRDRRSAARSTVGRRRDAARLAERLAAGNLSAAAVGRL